MLNSGGLLIPPLAQLTPEDRELCSISGRRLPLTSEHQASVNARFSQPLPWQNLEWFISTDATYESSKFTQVHNRAKAGAATLVGLQLGVENEQLRIALFGRNIFDEDAVINNTRWFDLRYNGFAVPSRAPAQVDGQPTDRSALGPRAFFTTLRRGATYGVQASYRF